VLLPPQHGGSTLAKIQLLVVQVSGLKDLQ
jgi:hypothetical protein